MAAAALVAPGDVIGLGSGRAVWATIDALAARLGEDIGAVTAVCASSRTEVAAQRAGLVVVPLVAGIEPVLAIDGADELTEDLDLLKGGGGAMLRERLVIASCARFVVVAEQAKLVDRLGATRRLPVEIVRFGATVTAARVAGVLDDPQLRLEDDGNPFITDEGHLVLDAGIPADADVAALPALLRTIPGVVDHGLFLGVAALAFLGAPDGAVTVLQPA
jgi:ribose 5-phosphate isomerase A